MRILLIKLRHIGDALIATPLVAGIRAGYPDAEITMIVRDDCRSILAGCAGLNQILTTADIRKANRRWSRIPNDLSLAWRLRRTRYDIAIDLGDNPRGRWLLTLARASMKAADTAGRGYPRFLRHGVTLLEQTKAERKRLHRVEKDYRVASQVLQLPARIPPLQFHEGAHQPWPGLDRTLPYVVVHAGTRWKRKRWPLDHWCRLLERLGSSGHRLVISCGPDVQEREEARYLQQHVGNGALTTDGLCSWSQLAWILAKARLFVGVDTAAMHLAAACQCPTVALFGPSRPEAWAPWSVPHILVRPPAEVLSRKPKGRDSGDWMATVIQSISVEHVWEACQKMLPQVNPDPL